MIRNREGETAVIDLASLERYRENNRIEAKLALGGLPHSIWETYSAFANTLGGVILLGVEERKDKTLHTVNLPDPEGMAAEFRRLLADPNKASTDLLRDRDVRVETVDGDHILVIEVPRAGPWDKPVYVDGNPRTGTYCRNGEGDYRCTQAEIDAMLAARDTPDSRPLEDLPMDCLNPDSIAAFCQRVPQSGEDSHALLQRLGAAAAGEDKVLHPTLAGLLFFGAASEIRRILPEYKLTYLEYREDSQCTYRRSSESEDWSGNLMDFIRLVNARLSPEHSPQAAAAVREALVNCLGNADFSIPGGVVISRGPKLITMSNPGRFRIRREAARSGGLSDPRNPVVMRLFCRMDLGSMRGSGIPFLFAVWTQQGWHEPVFLEGRQPPRTTLLLPFREDIPIPQGNVVELGEEMRTAWQRERLIAALTELGTAGPEELADLLQLRRDDVLQLAETLMEEGTVQTMERPGGRGICFRLRA